MAALIIILLLAFAGLMVFLFKKDPATEEPGRFPAAPAEEKTIFTEILDWETNNVYVAGLEHHCTKKDVGYFTGRIFNEADNAYDKKAMAIGSNQSGKIIGYVDCRCVGYIFFDGEHLRGRVRAYLPDTDPEKLVQDVEAYIKLAAEHFGWNIDGAQIEI